MDRVGNEIAYRAAEQNWFGIDFTFAETANLNLLFLERSFKKVRYLLPRPRRHRTMNIRSAHPLFLIERERASLSIMPDNRSYSSTLDSITAR